RHTLEVTAQRLGGGETTHAGADDDGMERTIAGGTGHGGLLLVVYLTRSFQRSAAEGIGRMPYPPLIRAGSTP
ncbi:MAG: hypothetical protein ACRD0W_17435, partial [Acidimicrobiales bacterium]